VEKRRVLGVEGAQLARAKAQATVFVLGIIPARGVPVIDALFRAGMPGLRFWVLRVIFVARALVLGECWWLRYCSGQECPGYGCGGFVGGQRCENGLR